MHTKLTLRIDAPLVKAAKMYSKVHGQSLSQLIANYLYVITATDISVSHTAQSSPPLTQALKGVLRRKQVSEADYKKYLEDKYQ